MLRIFALSGLRPPSANAVNRSVKCKKSIMEIDRPTRKETLIALVYIGLYLLPYLVTHFYVSSFDKFSLDLGGKLTLDGDVALYTGCYYAILSIYFGFGFFRYNLSAYQQQRWPPSNHRILVKYRVRKGVDAKKYSVFAIFAFVFLASVATVPNFYIGYVKYAQVKEYQELKKHVR